MGVMARAESSRRSRARWRADQGSASIGAMFYMDGQAKSLHFPSGTFRTICSPRFAALPRK